MNGAGVAGIDAQTVHGGYKTATVKCQVCHSAHKAPVAGEYLLPTTQVNSCVFCHGGATGIMAKKISTGNRHGGATQCTNGYCHSLSPHGAWTSQYASLSSMLLNANADPLIAAAIESGVTGLPQTAIADYPLGAPDGATTVTVFNPNVTQAMMDNADQTTNTLARSVGTGYICANGGCHINGQFNSLSTTAYLGVFTGSARPGAIKGHRLMETPSVDYPVGDQTTQTVAWAGTGRCNTCHDSVDSRIGDAKQFPHGNDNVQGGIAVGSTSAWFTVAENFGDTKFNTATRGIPTGAGNYTSAMDGACLKCHRNTTEGVGITY